VYGIILNDKTNGILCKSNKVRILSNCKNLILLFSLHLVSKFIWNLFALDWKWKQKIKLSELKTRAKRN
jgi:hypothetical protein